MRSAIVTLCLLLSLAATAVAEDVPTVVVTAEPGVLGQVVLVTVTITNPTSRLVVLTRLELRRDDRLITPGNPATWGTLAIAAGETRRLDVPLLWNAIPARPVDLEPRLYPDYVVFREAGAHDLTATVALNWGEWNESNGIRRLVLERIGEPKVIHFTAEVSAPKRKADRSWWQLVSKNPAYAEFLHTGSCHQNAQCDRVMQQVARFVKAYPTDRLGVALDARLKSVEALNRVDPAKNR
jgi:hypothetical protein